MTDGIERIIFVSIKNNEFNEFFAKTCFLEKSEIYMYVLKKVSKLFNYALT